MLFNKSFFRFILPALFLFGVGAAYVFASTTAPAVITGVYAVNIIGFEAQIVWITDEPSDSVVLYGTTTAGFANTATSRCDAGGMVTNHCVNLTGLSPSVTYYYKVRSTNSSGYTAIQTGTFMSASGSSGGGSTDVDSPTPPSSFSAHAVSSSQIDLSWSAATDNVGVVLYEIFRNGYVINTVSTFSYSDTGLSANTYYSYYVKAFDAAGNGSSGAYASTTTLPSITSTPTPTPSPTSVPTAPTTFSVSAVSPTSVVLSWSGATGSVGVMGYKIFRNGVYSMITTLTSYTDNSVTPDTPYAYYIQAVDTAGNVSSPSLIKDVRTPSVATSSSSVADTTRPTPPSTVSYTPASEQISFTWEGATDNVAVVGYKIYRNGVHFLTKSVPYCTDTGLLSNTAYSYYIRTFDAAGNESEPSQTLYVTTLASSAASVAPTATGTPQSVSATVVRGASSCDALIATTKMTFSATPSSGAYFKVTKSGGSAQITPSGTYDLPNGIYSWEAIANYGFVLPRDTYDKFILDTSCATDGTTTTETTNTQYPSTRAAYVTLLGEEVVHVSYGGMYVEAGAKGYTASGASVIPKRDLGGLDTAIPGTYKISYRLFDVLGKVTASTIRTVIVDSPVRATVAPSSVLVQPTTSAATDAASAPSAIFSLFAQSPGVSTIDTSEEYAHYCDDPLHQKECAQYASKQIIVAEVQSLVPSVTTEVFTTMVSEGVLPGGATSLEELKAVCGQSTYASSCADLYVATRVLSQKEANTHKGELLASRQSETQVLTERVGARMFQDTDGDDITDYDEINMYHTDPKKNDSNSDGIKDGEHLLLGTDPLLVTPILATSTTPTATTTPQSGAPVVSRKIVYEDPKFSGDTKPELLTVTNVKAVPVNISEEGTTSIKIALSGSALPNSFVTLFIFSDPIVVTVKADESGAWTYVLDKELPDGTHQVMSAITDGGGHILAKSAPLPFVKQAAAVSIGSPLLTAQPKAPGFFSGGSLYVLIATLVGVFTLALVLIGFIVKRRPLEKVSVEDNTEHNNFFP